MFTVMKRCGLVALISRPNAGKSMLLNRLIGQKISIVSDKPQTTRYRTLGIRTEGDCQIIFVDTPGIHRPGYRLNERMMETVYQTLREVDLVVQLVDVSEHFGRGEQYVLDLVKKTEKPTLLVLNKVDLINKGKVLPMIEFFRKQYDYQEIIPLSALKGDNVAVLVEKIRTNLPQADFFYGPEMITDQQERFRVAELIREKVLEYTRLELPYATAVLVELLDETQKEASFVRVVASVIVDKESQKKIVIGRGGRMIKAIGTTARKEIEELLQVRKVYLDLNVKVVVGWRNREPVLDQLVIQR